MNIVFAGTPEFAVPTLVMLLASEHRLCAVYTQPDRPAGRGRKLHKSPVKQLAEQSGIPVCQPLDLKTPEALQQLAAWKADLMIVVAYGMILPQSVLYLPSLGCINIHASLLPRWRGAAPIQRALIAGDAKTGITIMRVILKLDAGDMLHKEELLIGNRDTAADLHDKLAELGAVGLAKILPAIETGQLSAEKQDEQLVTYAHKLEKSEALLDWSQAAVDLDRKIRGLNPWPVAQTLLDGDIFRIWQAEVLDETTDTRPGAVLDAHRHLDIATGNGILRLLEVQLPGGKRLAAEAFLNAHDVKGKTLG